MRFNLRQAESVGKIAEVMEHHKVPGTNHLKLCFEFAKHFSHLSGLWLLHLQGLTDVLEWVDLLCAVLASSCHQSPC